ncbi:hypothetical protein QTP88_010105 [Uroleucon formosanum]
MGVSENVSFISTNEKFDKIMKMTNNIKTTQNKFITSVNSIRDKKKKIKTRNNAKIEKIESKISILEAKSASISDSTPEDIFSEILDRQARSRNLIFFDVPELPSDSNSNDMQSQGRQEGGAVEAIAPPKIFCVSYKIGSFLHEAGLRYLATMRQSLYSGFPNGTQKKPLKNVIVVHKQKYDRTKPVISLTLWVFYVQKHYKLLSLLNFFKKKRYNLLNSLNNYTKNIINY